MRRSNRKRTNARRPTRTNSVRAIHARISAVAANAAMQSRIPRDPPSIPVGFDHTVKVRVVFNMTAVSSTYAGDAYIKGLPPTPLANFTVRTVTQKAGVSLGASRAILLDYEEIFAAAYMRATSTDITASTSALARASVDFALLRVAAWGPTVAGSQLRLRVDPDPMIAGKVISDTAGKNHRAACAITMPTIAWRKFSTIDPSSGSVYLEVLNITPQALFPATDDRLSAGGIAMRMELGELHLTVRVRYGINVDQVAALAAALKGHTAYSKDGEDM